MFVVKRRINVVEMVHVRLAQHPVVSNLQILLREDSELADSSLMGAHRLKVEAAIQVIQTTPTLRGVAMESLSQAILLLFKHKDVRIISTVQFDMHDEVFLVFITEM